MESLLNTMMEFSHRWRVEKIIDPGFLKSTRVSKIQFIEYPGITLRIPPLRIPPFEIVILKFQILTDWYNFLYELQVREI